MTHEVCDPKAILAGDNAKQLLLRRWRNQEDRIPGDLKWSREFRKVISIMLNNGDIISAMVVLYSDRYQSVHVDDGKSAGYRAIPFADIAATELF